MKSYLAKTKTRSLFRTVQKFEFYIIWNYLSAIWKGGRMKRICWGNGDQEWEDKNVYGVTFRKRWHNQPNIDPPYTFNQKTSLFSDLCCDKQRQRHFSLLCRGLDVVSLPVLPRPQGCHPRPRPPPLLSHHHRHHPPQLHHDDPTPH